MPIYRPFPYAAVSAREGVCPSASLPRKMLILCGMDTITSAIVMTVVVMEESRINGQDYATTAEEEDRD